MVAGGSELETEKDGHRRPNPFSGASMRAQSRVLLVEDDEPIRAALDVALTGEGYRTRCMADGRGVEAVAQEFRPDLAILDVRFPEGPDGYAIARRLRSSQDVIVLFLTASDDLEDRLAAFESGADDHISKPFSMAEVLARVFALLRRSGRLVSPVSQLGDLIVDEDAHVVTRQGQPITVTETEYQLLRALMSHPGQVLSKGQLLSRIWGFDAYDSNVVEVHMSALRRKLEAKGPRLVHTVRGAGYVLRLP